MCVQNTKNAPLTESARGGLRGLEQRKAEDETRTRDPHLGKVMLYQLSYFRIFDYPLARAQIILKELNCVWQGAKRKILWCVASTLRLMLDSPSTNPALLPFLLAWNGSDELPDEASQAAGEVRFALGALDGILSHHANESEGGTREHQIAQLLDLIEHAVLQNDDVSHATLMQALEDGQALSLSDDLSQALQGQTRFTLSDMRLLAHWLLKSATTRETFKIALVLLGLSGDENDLDVLIALARHPEFTLYCVVAAGRIAPEPTDVWWQMARSAQGWDKIHLVERLAPKAQSRPDLQGWLLREGCQNSIMDEYLAWPCAHFGDLRGALERGEDDDALLDGVGHILMALGIGGPARDMRSYPDGAEATALFLRVLQPRCDTIWRLLVVTSLERFLIRIADDTGKTDWASLGWTSQAMASMRALCTAIMARPEWKARLQRELDGHDWLRAHFCATRLGLDFWEQLFARLEDDPFNASLYSCLLTKQSRERKERIAEFARSHLPLQAIASGPAQESWIGSKGKFQNHFCLDLIVWAMSREGEDHFFDATLVDVALRSPLVSSRNAALRALQAWPRETWGVAVERTFMQRQNDEPDTKLRERMQDLV
jgi:hypothetical protein